jgi:hypothetical protein
VSERLLVTGDRYWSDATAVTAVRRELLRFPAGTVVIHGAAGGIDTVADLVAKSLWGPQSVEPYPADWRRYKRGAGMIRNREMLERGRPTRVLAFHPCIARSKGTKDMIEIARAAGLPVDLFER